MRRIKLVFIVLYLLFLALPLLRYELRFVKENPVDENRTLMPKPIFNWDAMVHFDRYFADLSAHLRDKFGFRHTLIRIKNQLYSEVFGHTKDISIGKNGFLFYPSVLNDYLESEAGFDANIAFVVAKLKRLERYLAARNAILFIVPIPLKQVIYPEYYPKPEQLRRITWREKLYKRLEQESLPHADLTQVLLDAKSSEGTPYYKTDFHWNTYGAARGGSAILKHLFALQGQSFIPREMRTRINKDFIGGQGKALALFFEEREDAYEQVNEFPSCRTLVKPTAKEFDWRFEHAATDICPSQSLPKTIIVGDSFTSYMYWTDFPAYFDQLTRVVDLKSALPLLDGSVQIVIYEMIEGPFHRLYSPDHWPLELSEPWEQNQTRAGPRQRKDL